MANLYGRNYTRQEILERVGDISQLCGVRLMRLQGGMQDGVEVAEFRTGSGFCFYAVPGRGLDITTAEHNGRALAWRSAAGETSPMFYEEPGLGWLRSFPGGLVTTCGLTYAGAPCEDEGEMLGLHGRFSNTPASNLNVDGEWDGDDYRIWAAGKIRESRLFGENLLLRRKVWTVLGDDRFTIEDTVTNEGPRTVPHMILYHINGGFPVVDTGSQFISPSRSATPRDADAETDKEHYYSNDAPTRGFAERCYYHDMAADADGFVETALVNRSMPGGAFGFYVRYNIRELPEFTQWKMNGEREYVVGMEPANCRVQGRAIERRRGALQFLEPGETRSYTVEICILDGAAQVDAFEERAKSLTR